MLTQQKLEELAMQRSYVEITEAKMSSCFEYATYVLDTGTVHGRGVENEDTSTETN